MSITLDIIENGHVLLYTFRDPWQVDDLIALYSRANDHIKDAPYKVHSVADLRNSKNLAPQGVLRARSGAAFSHPNSGHVVVVGANGFAQRMAEVVFKFVNFKRVMFFEDMDKAMAYLHELSLTETENIPL